MDQRWARVWFAATALCVVAVTVTGIAYHVALGSGRGLLNGASVSVLLLGLAAGAAALDGRLRSAPIAMAGQPGR